MVDREVVDWRDGGLERWWILQKYWLTEVAMVA